MATILIVGDDKRGGLTEGGKREENSRLPSAIFSTVVPVLRPLLDLALKTLARFAASSDLEQALLLRCPPLWLLVLIHDVNEQRVRPQWWKLSAFTCPLHRETPSVEKGSERAAPAGEAAGCWMLVGGVFQSAVHQ